MEVPERKDLLKFIIQAKEKLTKLNFGILYHQNMIS